jgi:tetratricopeptide (TPR) repeat protein
MTANLDWSFIMTTLTIVELLERAFLAFDDQRLEEAEILYRQVLAQALPDTEDYRNATFMLGFVKSHLGEFDEARQLYQSLLQDAQQRNETRAIGIQLHQLGMVERLAKNYEQASVFFDREYTHLQTHLPNFYAGFSANAYERGYIQLLQGNVETAKSLLDESLRMADLAQDPICRACALRGLGEVALKQSHPQQARTYWQESQDAFREGGDEKGADEIQQYLNSF